MLEETTAFLQWLEEDNFVFLGMREYSYTGALDGRRRSGGGKRPRPAPRPRVTVLRRGEAVTHDARDPRFPHGARSAHRDQGERQDARPPPRLHGLIGAKLFRDGKIRGELRIVGLFTSVGLHARRDHSAHPR